MHRSFPCTPDRVFQSICPETSYSAPLNFSIHSLPPCLLEKLSLLMVVTFPPLGDTMIPLALNPLPPPPTVRMRLPPNAAYPSPTDPPAPSCTIPVLPDTAAPSYTVMPDTAVCSDPCTPIITSHPLPPPSPTVPIPSFPNAWLEGQLQLRSA
jgi:hypothetical protein